MDKEQFLALIQKYLVGEASLEEEQLLLNFYGSFQDTLVWDESMLGLKAEIEAKILQKVQAHIMQQSVQVPVAADRLPVSSDRPLVKLWTGRWSGSGIGVAVAAAVAVITLGIWLYYTPRHPDAGQDPGRAQYANDIAPGKNTATLTLANGKTINLSDAKAGVVIGDDKLTYDDGSAIRHPELVSGSRTGEASMLTASTPRGGTYQVVLPDGTKVWLNADSKISFPSQFTGKERKIMLSGEAYFEVSTSHTSLRGRRTKQSFIVESRGQQVEVLGTHFNINSYADESSTKTTLIEGSVAVRQDDDRFNVVLKPGEQSTLYEGAIKVQPANVEETISWKNGDFVFNGEPLRDIMRKLSRWYNVDIVYEGDVANEQYTAKISRNKNISEVIQLLEQAEGVHFKIEGRRVIVTP